MAQKTEHLNLIKSQAKAAFEEGEYERSVALVNQIPSFSREIPPSYQSLRIKALSAIIARNSLHDYQQIATTRRFIADYLKNPSSKKNDPSYNSVIEISKQFDLYPKDESRFLALVEEKKKAAKLEIEREAREILERDIQERRNDSIAKVNALEAARIAEIERKEKIKKDSIAAIEAVKAASRAAIEKENNDALALEAEKKQQQENAKTIRQTKFASQRFSNLGFQSGEIARYGLLYEYGGGKKILGFHLSARTSLTPDTELLSGKTVVNKTEFDIGPSFKLANWLFLNIGGGYGFYNYVFRNDYVSDNASLEMEPYLVTSGGLMIRLGRIINLSGGVSFMDINKGLYKPEITGGLSFNLKSK